MTISVLGYQFPVIMIFGILMSLFYGCYAARIYYYAKRGDSPWQMHWSWRIHQFWLNFCGSFIGWIFLWVLVENYETPKTISMGLYQIFTVLLGVLGIVGFMPQALYTLSIGLAEFIKKYLGK